MDSGVSQLELRRFYYQAFKNPKNFESFCRFVLPKAFTKPFAPFHKEIIADFIRDGDSYVAAPRGHGKSTLIGQGFVLWCILYKLKKYIVYTSQNHTKSVQFLEPVRNELLHNNRINFIYGKQEAKNSYDENGKNREDVLDVNGVRLQALSFEKNIRGLKHGNQRPDLIIPDDIEDDGRVLNPELRRKDSDKLDKQIIPSLDPTSGVIKMIGTLLHHDSLLSKKLSLFGGKIYRACELDKDGKVLEDTILFPAMYTMKILEQKMFSIGSTAFQSEYLNNPVDDVASLIKREWVTKCFDESLSFSDKIPVDCILGADFAYSDRVSADKSAFVIVESNNGYIVRDCITRKGMSITQQFNLLQELHSKHLFSNLALEENSIRSMSDELKTYDFPFMLFWTGSSDNANRKSIDPYFEGKRHTVGKINMINRLATQFENCNIRIPYKTESDKLLAHQIRDECCSFALSDGRLVEVGVHPDIPIGLGYAIECASKDGFVMDF